MPLGDNAICKALMPPHDREGKEAALAPRHRARLERDIPTWLGQKVAAPRGRVHPARPQPPNCPSVVRCRCAFRSSAGTVVALRPAALSNASQITARVLLVEDDSALGELFAQVLAERGHLVALAGDVPSAVELLGHRAFDVIVTDLRLPGASGLELLAWVQARGLPVRVVVASAFATIELALHARRLGAREVLSKPIEPAALVAAVEAA